MERRELVDEWKQIEGALSWWLEEMQAELEDQLRDWDYWEEILNLPQEDEE